MQVNEVCKNMCSSPGKYAKRIFSLRQRRQQRQTAEHRGDIIVHKGKHDDNERRNCAGVFYFHSTQVSPQKGGKTESWRVLNVQKNMRRKKHYQTGAGKRRCQREQHENDDNEFLLLWSRNRALWWGELMHLFFLVACVPRLRETRIWIQTSITIPRHAPSSSSSWIHVNCNCKKVSSTRQTQKERTHTANNHQHHKTRVNTNRVSHSFEHVKRQEHTSNTYIYTYICIHGGHMNIQFAYSTKPTVCALWQPAASVSWIARARVPQRKEHINVRRTRVALLLFILHSR